MRDTSEIFILAILLGSAFFISSMYATEFSALYARRMPSYYPKDNYVWQKTKTVSFDELILSWNGQRPLIGSFIFYVRVHYSNQWSPWQKIFQWGSDNQRSFVNAHHPIVHAKHTRFELVNGRKGDGFAVKIVASDGAALDDLHSLMVSVSDSGSFSSPASKKFESVMVKNVPKQSQMMLSHRRKFDLCSPTSLAIVLDYWRSQMKFSFKGSKPLKMFTLDIAKQVRDQCYLDIFGNWVLNSAQVYDTSRGQLIAWVQRLHNFGKLYEYLQSNSPVIVSVRGPLAGSASSYKNGHLLVVIGYDAINKKVICIDPAFKTNDRTYTSYKLDDFLKAWGRSRNMSYLIVPLS